MSLDLSRCRVGVDSGDTLFVPIQDVDNGAECEENAAVNVRY